MAVRACVTVHPQKEPSMILSRYTALLPVCAAMFAACLGQTASGAPEIRVTGSSVTINNNADWLLLTIPSGGVGDVTPNDIHVLVAQGNDADTSAQELGPQ